METAIFQAKIRLFSRIMQKRTTDGHGYYGAEKQIAPCVFRSRFGDSILSQKKFGIARLICVYPRPSVVPMASVRLRLGARGARECDPGISMAFLKK
jgi:hypothetical protein